jgi:ribosome-binding protein aMBF1 (putative translation factor)
MTPAMQENLTKAREAHAANQRQKAYAFLSLVLEEIPDDDSIPPEVLQFYFELVAADAADEGISREELMEMIQEEAQKQMKKMQKEQRPKPQS